jgi:hypothetical protein
MQIFVVCFLLGNSPASEFYMPMFRNIESMQHSEHGESFKSRYLLCDILNSLFFQKSGINLWAMLAAITVCDEV